MTRSSYEEALSRLLRDEGGYTNHPADPGGPTNWGITIGDARAYWKNNATAADVRAMPLDVAKGIYRARYWDAQRCDDLPAGVDYAVFDYGVNSGIGRSGKVLRRALRMPDNASAVSDDVIARAAGVNAADLIDLICMERLAFLKSLKTWPVFGAGWNRRVAGVRTAALAMASGRSPRAPAAASSRFAAGKAIVPINTAGRNVSAGAVVASGTAASAHAPDVAVAMIAVGAACAALLAVLAFWRRDQRRRQEAPVQPDISSGQS